MEKAPTDYSKSKVYTIRSHQTDKYYIGSTTQSLSKRFSKHKETYASYLNGKACYVSSYEILKLGDAYIELLEDVPCETKEQLHKREGELIRQYKDHVVNVNIPGRNKAMWHQEHRDQRLKQLADYYAQNKEEINQKRREERATDGEKLRAKDRAYRKANNKKLKEYYNKKTDCACGGLYSVANKARHMKTEMHLTYEKNKV
jgi:hypothetical protein